MAMASGARVSAILYPKLHQPAHVISTPTCKRKIGWHTNNCKRLLVLHSQSQKSLALAQEAQCPNPETLEQAAEQAQLAIDKAILDGKRLQLLDLLLPVDQRQFNYLDTEPRDYPCGINAEFLACCKVMTLVMRGLKVAGPEAEILSRKIGEFQNEMDPVGLLYPSNKSVAAVVFPIAESLKKVRSLVEDEPSRPIFLVNPQWRASGQVVSDFGFGPWRRQAELFLEKFERTYALFEQRIGEASNVISGSGGVVRILKCYPYDWHCCCSWPSSFVSSHPLLGF